MDHLCGHPGLAPYLLTSVTLTGTRIGVGTCGCVEEVRIPGAVCAAKKIRDDHSETPESEIQRAAAHKIVEDCRVMSTLRHPHITQFLGVCFFPGERLPALVMERLSTSLHDLLHNPPSTDTTPYIPMHLKCSIIHDVANGLTYLHEHSPPVIHGNLSARNVLLNTAMVAKITDIGVAHIVRHLTAAASTIKSSGALLYMPPEAVASALCNNDRANYTSCVDIFSLGVVSIFTLSQSFPCNLLEPTYTDEESGMLKARTELERRNEYMEAISALLPQGHPLIQMIQRCLHNVPALRPSIREVVLLVEQARAEVHAREGHPEYSMTRLQLIQALHSQPGSEVEELRQKLESCQIENRTITQQLQRKETELSSALQTLHQQSCKDTGRSQEAESTIPQPTTGPICINRAWQSNSASTSTGRTSENTLRVQCYIQKSAKHNFLSRGSATIDGNFAYFTPSNRSCVLMYNAINGKWTELPNCLCSNAALVCIDGALVAVGGESDAVVSNKLFTLRSNQWVEEYPPMNTPRSQCAVVSVTDSQFKSHVIVIGGKTSEDNCSGVDWTDSVEFFNTSSRCWYQLNNLPQPLLTPSVTVSGYTLYVISSTGDSFTCSLQNIDETQPPVLWSPLPQLPVMDATAATLCRQLVLIGGRADGTAVGFIHQLVGEQWVKIGSTLIPRQECLVVSPSPEKVIIVGGVGSWNSVELCNAE